MLLYQSSDLAPFRALLRALGLSVRWAISAAARTVRWRRKQQPSTKEKRWRGPAALLTARRTEVYPAGRKKSRSLLHQGLALAEEEGLLWPLPL